MRVVASTEARELVRERGGRLFVWAKTSRCCGPITYLRASTEAPEREFRRVEADGIDVYFSAGIRELPDELHVELRGRLRRRLEAYWDGCAYVV
jgi:hypothetical protein